VTPTLSSENGVHRQGRPAYCRLLLSIPRAWPQRKAQRQAEREDALTPMAAQREQEEIVPLAVRTPLKAVPLAVRLPKVPRSQPPRGGRKGSTARGACPAAGSTARGAAGGKR
jgi:hypothetical protein